VRVSVGDGCAIDPVGLPQRQTASLQNFSCETGFNVQRAWSYTDLGLLGR
jgi:hypothetical protein